MDKAFLLDLLSQPTAPYREGHVLRRVVRRAAERGIPWFADRWGNLVLGAASEAEARRRAEATSEEPLRLFMAHSDHPGFHGKRWRRRGELEVTWHGGSPAKGLEGASVYLATDEGVVGEGRIASVKPAKGGRGIAAAVVKVKADLSGLPEESLFGGFSFRKPAWASGKTIYTKAADDLVGVFAILETAEAARERGLGESFLGLVTRAEEVGFIGAIAHLELGWLKAAPRGVVCVSLETSRQLPGAEIGKGPIVRLGDRATTFDPAATKVLHLAAQKALGKRYQRRIMDGGTCEATAALALGFSAIGISIPLGNYHNQNFEGGPGAKRRDGAAPEFVDIRDVEGLLKLASALCEPGLPWRSAWEETAGRFRGMVTEAQSLLLPPPRVSPA